MCQNICVGLLLGYPCRSFKNQMSKTVAVAVSRDFWLHNVSNKLVKRSVSGKFHVLMMSRRPFFRYPHLARIRTFILLEKLRVVIFSKKEEIYLSFRYATITQKDLHHVDLHAQGVQQSNITSVDHGSCKQGQTELAFLQNVKADKKTRRRQRKKPLPPLLFFCFVDRCKPSACFHQLLIRTQYTYSSAWLRFLETLPVDCDRRIDNTAPGGDRKPANNGHNNASFKCTVNPWLGQAHLDRSRKKAVMAARSNFSREHLDRFFGSILRFPRLMEALEGISEHWREETEKSKTFFCGAVGLDGRSSVQAGQSKVPVAVGPLPGA